MKNDVYTFTAIVAVEVTVRIPSHLTVTDADEVRLGMEVIRTVANAAELPQSVSIVADGGWLVTLADVDASLGDPDPDSLVIRNTW